MVLGLLEVELFLPEAQSLKDKRQIVKSVTNRVKAKFNVSVAETDHRDLWQRATLAIAAVAESGEQVRKMLNTIESFIESLNRGLVVQAETTLFYPEK